MTSQTDKINNNVFYDIEDYVIMLDVLHEMHITCCYVIKLNVLHEMYITRMKERTVNVSL